MRTIASSLSTAAGFERLNSAQGLRSVCRLNKPNLDSIPLIFTRPQYEEIDRAKSHSPS